VRPAPAAKGPSRIRIDGAFDDWRAVTPEFRDTIGDTLHRDHKGYGGVVYRNDSGRNDFVIVKAGYDNRCLYFFAQTLESISPRTDRNWMLLLIDADRESRTGWLGYDFVVNLDVLSDTESTLKAWRAGKWETVGRADYRVDGSGMELSLERALVGQGGTGTPTFDFHWADNLQGFDDVSELGLSGDSAPNRRWNSRFAVVP